jgi:membrane-bound metal-dependent hydrolase YbcI (DUF457 family)
MNLFFHELTHLFLSLLIGYLVWRFLKKSLAASLLGGLLGGFLVDIDHFFDYIKAFGLRFNFYYFANGSQFAKTNKIYIPLHSFELAILLFLLGFLILKKSRIGSFLIAFSLALFIHLLIDTAANHMPFQAYFLTDRILNHFDLRRVKNLFF